MKKNDYHFLIVPLTATLLTMISTLILLTGCKRLPMETLHAHETGIEAILFSPDGSVLAGSYSGGKIIIWDMTTRRPMHTIMTGSGANAKFLSFSHDGHTLLAFEQFSPNDTITLWDIRSGQMKKALEPSPFLLTGALLKGVQGKPGAALWKPEPIARKDENNLREGEEDDLRSFLRIRFSSQHRASAFSPDGKLLATSYQGKSGITLTLWNGETGNFKRLINLWTDPRQSTFLRPATSVPVPPPPPPPSKRDFLVAKWNSGSASVKWLDNMRLFVIAQGRRGEGVPVDIFLLDARTGKTIWKIDFSGHMGKSGFEKTPSVFDVTVDGKMLARDWYREKTTRRFRLRSFRTVKKTTYESAVVVLYPQSKKKVLKLGKRSYQRKAIHITSISFSPDGRYLAAGSSDGLIWLWNLGPQIAKAAN